jgi:hypothetical protein
LPNLIFLIMGSEDIRWIQRFSNFEKAFLRFKESLQVEDPNELERNGIVQRFEFTLENTQRLSSGRRFGISVLDELYSFFKNQISKNQLNLF